jgi:hypothetical protein
MLCSGLFRGTRGQEAVNDLPGSPCERSRACPRRPGEPSGLSGQNAEQLTRDRAALYCHEMERRESASYGSSDRLLTVRVRVGET